MRERTSYAGTSDTFSDEEGSATVGGVGAILGLIAVATLLGVHVTGLVNQHRADAAADLTALSAATVQVGAGVGEACARASSVAEANGATLTDCCEIVGGGPDAPAGTVGGDGDPRRGERRGSGLRWG